jgi:hypothetical protein
MSTPAQPLSTAATPAAAGLGDALRRRVTGVVHVPGEPGYDAARTPWNVAADQRPAAVVVPQHAEDVAAVLRVAAEAGLRVAPQGTGHAAASLPALDGAILLLTTALGRVTVDPKARTARVGAGARMGEVVAAAAAHGLAPVAGSTGGTSAVGFCLGGGTGFLGRQHGLGCASVTAVELMLADGRVVRADATIEPELFWALRGGGGGFGVVTAIELVLHPVAELTAGAMLWPLERADEILHTWRDWTRGAGEEATTFARLLRFPPFPQVPEPLRGRAFVVVVGAITGDTFAAEAALAPFRALGPELDSWRVTGPEALVEVNMDPLEPTPASHGHVLLADADDHVLAGMLELAGPGVETPLLFVELRHLGGALARPVPGGAALEAIPAEYALCAVGVPMGPAAAAVPAALAAVEALGGAQALGVLPTLSEGDGPEQMYPPEVLTRLRAVKSAADPGGVLLASVAL